jgi:hypothetical protein
MVCSSFFMNSTVAVEYDLSSSILRTMFFVDFYSSSIDYNSWESHLANSYRSCIYSFERTYSKACWIWRFAFEFCSLSVRKFFYTSFFRINKFSMLVSIRSNVASSSLFITGWDFFIVFTSWSLCLPKISIKLPWMTHSGQMHSHLQVKQKYMMSSSMCSPQVFLDEMPLINWLETPEAETSLVIVLRVVSYARGFTDSGARPMALCGGWGINF